MPQVYLLFIFFDKSIPRGDWLPVLSDNMYPQFNRY